jgi:membrane-bound lytic murein transglycosylase D
MHDSRVSPVVSRLKQIAVTLLATSSLLAVGACSSLNTSGLFENQPAGEDPAADQGRQAKEAAGTKASNASLSAGNATGSMAGANGMQPGSAQVSFDLIQPLEEEVTDPPPEAEGSSKEPLSKSEQEALESKPEIEFELDIQETRVMRDYLHYYTKRKHRVFQNWLDRAEPYLPYIRKVVTEHGLPQDLVFLPFAESGFNPRAYSRAGAAGMWQFMPGTARLYGLEVNWWIDERRDPYKSTHAAMRYLKKLYKQFGDWYLVLAAYNCGEGRVAWALRTSGQEDYFDLTKSRRYLYRETRHYVPKYLAILKIVRNLEKLGFDSFNWDAPKQPTSVSVPGGTDLYGLARAVGLSWSEFRKHNPAFRRLASPPGREVPVYLPEPLLAKAKSYAEKARQQPNSGFTRYQVSRGDSWWRISRLYHVPISQLKQVNRTRSNLLRPGEWILIPVSASASVNRGGGSHDGSYTVRRGDNLWEIARRFNVTVAALRRANSLPSDARRLQIGQSLRIPGHSNAYDRRRIAQKRANYTIKKGDTLWELSQRFGVSLQTLTEANGLANKNYLRPGSKLYIPDLGDSGSKPSKIETGQTGKSIQYRVRKGDNLWNIARRFGVSTQKLLHWNELSRNQLIHPGDELTIYVHQ